jgi:RecJ-like exonuclease
MAVVRPRSRRPGWFPALAASAVIVVSAIVGIVVVMLRDVPDAAPALGPTVQRIIAEVDVIAVSLYTDATVRQETVIAPEEYAAAREAVQRVRHQWQSIRDAVEPTKRDRIDELVERLDTAIANRATPSSVREIVDELEKELESLASFGSR